MHDVTVASHELIFIIFFVEFLFILANGKHVIRCNYQFQNKTIVYLRT